MYGYKFRHCRPLQNDRLNPGKQIINCLCLVGILLWTIISLADLQAQILLTEVMYDPDTLENYAEFVELYNAGTAPVDLQGWRIGDGQELDLIVDAGEGLLLAPQQWAVVLDPGYFDHFPIYQDLIPAQALQVTIEDGAFGRGGWSNSRPDSVILTNPSGDTVQLYQYPPGNPPGYSMEKIELTASNHPTNWAPSKRFRGTPGSLNSVSPKQVDLEVRQFALDATPLLSGLDIGFRAWVKNVGLQPIEQWKWLAFYDQNADGYPQAEEIVQQEEVHEPTLLPGDSVDVEGEFPSLPEGEVRFGFAALAPGDQDSLNNRAFLSAEVLPSRMKVVINEIMFQPLPGMAEWVELYNTGSREVDLSDLYFADERDTVALVQTPRTLLPRAYLILSGDSEAAAQYGFSPQQLQVVKNFPTLNNEADDLKLLATNGYLVDRVPYSRQWFRREVDKGVSLEKIHPSFNGQVAGNWAASVDPTGSTPGRENSLYTEVLPPATALQIQPNPFSPDQDGREDFAILQYQLPVETAFVTLRIFDLRGRLIRTLARDAPSASQGQLVWDGQTDQGRTARMGAYVVLLQALNSEKRVLLEARRTVILIKGR